MRERPLEQTKSLPDIAHVQPVVLRPDSLTGERIRSTVELRSQGFVVREIGIAIGRIRKAGLLCLHVNQQRLGGVPDHPPSLPLIHRRPMRTFGVSRFAPVRRANGSTTVDVTVPL